MATTTLDRKLERAAIYSKLHKETVPKVSDLKWTSIHGETEYERKYALEQLNKAYYNLPYINRRK